MNTLRTRFESAGGRLIADGDTLRIQAPRPLPPDILSELRARRDLLLDTYRERAAIREHDGGLPRADAEREAATDALTVLDSTRRTTRPENTTPPEHRQTEESEK